MHGIWACNCLWNCLTDQSGPCLTKNMIIVEFFTSSKFLALLLKMQPLLSLVCVMRIISQRPFFPKWKLLSCEIEAASESEEESAKTGSAHRVLRVTTWWDPKFEVGVPCCRRVKSRVKNQKRWHLPNINQYQHQRDPPPKKWFWSEGPKKHLNLNILVSKFVPWNLEGRRTPDLEGQCRGFEGQQLFVYCCGFCSNRMLHYIPLSVCVSQALHLTFLT